MIAWIVLGLINGLALALMTLGIVLVYKAGRFVNFAHGQLGVLSALLLGKLVLDFGWNWWIALPFSVALGVLIGAASEIIIIRRLAGRSRVFLLIATIGLSQVLYALTFYTWLGPDRDRLHFLGFPMPFKAHVQVGALTLGGHHLLTVALVPLLAAGLAIVLKYTLIGKTIRAAASNPDAASLSGISVRRVSAIAWAIAGGLSAVGAILVAPDQPVFDMQALGPSLLLRALGAAAIAGFTSLPWAFGAGIFLGLVEAMTLFVTHNAGAADLVIFITVLIGLFVRARAVDAAGHGTTDRLEFEDRPIVVPATIKDRFLVRRSRASLIGAGLFIGLIAPFLPVFRAQDRMFVLALTLVIAVLAASVTVLTGWSGQVSLGQFALLGVGAFIAARSTANGWSLPATVILCGVIGAIIAILIGLPALRLSGLTLAVTTIGFAVIAPAWLFRQEWFAPSDTITVTAPHLAGVGAIQTQRSVYFAALIFLTVVFLGLGMLRRTGPGRAIIAVRDNEVTATAFGLSPAAVKVSAFALSGFLAASAGALWLTAWRTVSVSLFPAQQSLVILTLAVIGGVQSIPGALVAAVMIFGIPQLTGDFVKAVFSNTLQFQLFLSGLAVLLITIRYPTGVAGFFRHRWQRTLDSMGRLAERRAQEQATRRAEAVLAIEDLTVSFGGLRAVDGVSISVREGEIVGLIGTNGAGKTTILNAISGVITPASGRLWALGREIGNLSPEYRAHVGVGRSFQDARLFPGLTVRETIQVALHTSNRVGVLASMMGAPWVRFTERRTRAKADELIDLLGLQHWAGVSVGELSTGTRRICDLATQVAMSPQLLLLDEPTAGIAQREAEAFGPLLRTIVDQLKCSVLIIEHDMPLMLGLADRIYCLEAGRVIAEGTAQEIRQDPVVVASYLGTKTDQIEAPKRRRKTPQDRTVKFRAEQPPAENRSGNGSRKVARTTPTEVEATEAT